VSVAPSEFQVFSPNAVLLGATQEAVFAACARDILDDALAGISGSILAYGQSGAGKTWTMIGPGTDYAQRGIVPRAISYIFNRVDATPAEQRLRVRVSYLEIYNDRCLDLLGRTPETAEMLRAVMGDEVAGAENSGAAKAADVRSAGVRSRATTVTQAPAGANPLASASQTNATGPTVTSDRFEPLAVAEDRAGRVHVRGLSTPLVRNEADALNWLFTGETARVLAEHQLNKASTRSHCIFTIYIEQQLPADDSAGVEVEDRVTVLSKVHFVDLAGSERVKKTGSEGAVLREAQAINRSLSFLEQVM
jgi:kinesin family protein 6/9